MSVPTYQLFYGFRVDDTFHHALDEVDEEVKIFFIQDDDRHLHRVRHNGNLYLGKFLGDKSDLKSLPNVERNIYSILSRLVPKYSYQETELLLFPAEKTIVR